MNYLFVCIRQPVFKTKIKTTEARNGNQGNDNGMAYGINIIINYNPDSG